MAETGEGQPTTGRRPLEKLRKVFNRSKEVESHSQKELIPKQDLQLFQEVGSRHGVQIEMIAEQGKDYETRESVGGFGHISRKQVPEGKVLVGMTYQGDLANFWRDVYMETRKSQQPSEETAVPA